MNTSMTKARYFAVACSLLLLIPSAPLEAAALDDTCPVTVTGGNPKATLALASNQNITQFSLVISLVKGSTFNSFPLQAPVVPEPSSLILAGLAIGAWGYISIRKGRFTLISPS